MVRANLNLGQLQSIRRKKMRFAVLFSNLYYKLPSVDSAQLGVFRSRPYVAS